MSLSPPRSPAHFSVITISGVPVPNYEMRTRFWGSHEHCVTALNISSHNPAMQMAKIYISLDLHNNGAPGTSEIPCYLESKPVTTKLFVLFFSLTTFLQVLYLSYLSLRPSSRPFGRIRKNLRIFLLKCLEKRSPSINQRELFLHFHFFAESGSHDWIGGFFSFSPHILLRISIYLHIPSANVEVSCKRIPFKAGTRFIIFTKKYKCLRGWFPNVQNEIIFRHFFYDG